MKLSESISVNDYTKKYLIEGDTCDIGKKNSRTLNNKSGLITIEELEFNEREMEKLDYDLLFYNEKDLHVWIYALVFMDERCVI